MIHKYACFILVTKPLIFLVISADVQKLIQTYTSNIPQQTPESITNIIGGVYTNNVTLYFRNSPYRVQSDLIVEDGATLTIETGVQIYFDTGIGLKVKGTIEALGNEFARIQLLPFQKAHIYDDHRPEFRLIDGPSVRQGRLQIKFRHRWRSVCTMLTNWTVVDTRTACRSMHYEDGGFWKWFRRNNDTYPFVMPQPECLTTKKSLWECSGFVDTNSIRMSENLCQGEDDIGIYCWGRPTFPGWAKHWKGLQILNSPYKYVNSDPDMVSIHMESLSRLEYVDILHAGYDGASKNVTAAIWIEGVAPVMNGLFVDHSARDGIYIYETPGPVLIANSTISFNRGHGISIESSKDGRVFINNTIIENNYGDGVYYTQKAHDHLLSINRTRRQKLTRYGQNDSRINICAEHSASGSQFFPYLIEANLKSGTFIESNSPSSCWITIESPARLDYTYTVQFLNIESYDSFGNGDVNLILCDGSLNSPECHNERVRVPIMHGIFPQSISLRGAGRPILVSLGLSALGALRSNISVLFKIHAFVSNKALYGLNITNTLISNNTGNGIVTRDSRERTALTNVSLVRNEGLAGFLVQGGAADIWINSTRIEQNWGDGINISYAGGSVIVNGTSIINNRWRGFAFHHNNSIPYIALHQEIIFKGRPLNNIFYHRTLIMGNRWGGIVFGNSCIPVDRNVQPKISVTWSEFLANSYHPSIEVHSCQKDGMANLLVDITGNRIEGGSGIGFRMEPAVNTISVISSNHFINNNNTALLIRNAAHSHLAHLYSEVTISKNSFKFNIGKSIVTIGLNEGAQNQKLLFNQQNEVRENEVINPFPYLNPRSSPYAAVVVSSSNVVLRRNCFKNPRAKYEIATDLSEHAKSIDARENNWGYPRPELFMHRIFDQFNRYSLASIEINPFAAVCNHRKPHIALVQQFYRSFKKDSEPYNLGGTIWENQDLVSGRYTVTDDLNIVPGARLTISPNTILEFSNGVGMLVQGELIRADMHTSNGSITFTSRPFSLPRISQIRLVDENDNSQVMSGRLEVSVNDEWGTVCNRSWTKHLALLACNQLGLIMDDEHFENWRTFASKGDLPLVMDNIRCEESEYDITKCRHDGVEHNIASSCDATQVVGVRCLEPRWSGVRYSMLASPPTITGQATLNKWIIEKAGLYDFRIPQFIAALHIDWNYYTFNDLTIRDNFWTGIDIVYNDLTRKPAIRSSRFENNRRHGVKLRSIGITIEDVTITNNGYAGIRYKPQISHELQRDIVTWLERKEQPEMEANNVFVIPNSKLTTILIYESQLNQRKFLLAKATEDCPEHLLDPCNYELTLEAAGFEYGLSSKIVIQIINPVNGLSDEDILIVDSTTDRIWSTRKDSIMFPIVSSSNKLKLKYTRTYGSPEIGLLVLHLDSQEYLDRFVHVYQSEISSNQYAIASTHYSNLTLHDGSIINRLSNERIWIQKTNFTNNKQSILWINSPQHVVIGDTPIAKIQYHIDNCSLTHNSGPMIASHRDTYRSANVFSWKFWSNTFANNTNAAIVIHLPDSYDLRSRVTHEFVVTENRFLENKGFTLQLHGYYAFVNISSNNFTGNFAEEYSGITMLIGMEKTVIFERNRFYSNWGRWMLKINSLSHSLYKDIHGVVQYNYFLNNHYITSTQDYVDMWPRSFTVGIYGSQLVDIHFNRFKNSLLDFELVSGCKTSELDERLNVTYNWWGIANEAEISQRIFDFDDWNSFTIAEYSPFYSMDELFINYWWSSKIGQTEFATHVEPSLYDLKGRMYESKTLKLDAERWHQFPFYYKPNRPYRITKDLTIMPGATLTIEKGVEVHVWPNVRILVLGDLIADGTLWQPIRFKPINVTEFSEITRIRRKRSVEREQSRKLRENFTRRNKNSKLKRRAQWIGEDIVYQQFTALKREYTFYQKFDIRLNGTDGFSGFLEIFNATSGRYIPSCDQEFTIRSAQVVCRQLGLSVYNAYHWLTPRWEYNPRIRILEFYSEPRECYGTENRLDECRIRINGNPKLWQCVDSEHFNYIHCALSKTLNENYIDNWGGVVFAEASLDKTRVQKRDASILRNVEVVGGGFVHNETVDSSAILSIRRSPFFENVNVTNSSMHAIQIIGSSGKVVINRVNISENRGRALDIWLSNYHGAGGSTTPATGKLSIPYNLFGMIDICSSRKVFNLTTRVLLFYKYDSYAVDCVKQFVSIGRNIIFRFLQVNLYNGSKVNLGREDSISVYSDGEFLNLLHRYPDNINDFASTLQFDSHLAIHLRASAADSGYGFIAEIFTLPSENLPDAVNEVVIRQSRLLNNDRGALKYTNVGEIGPDISFEECAVENNGYHIYGNITTSSFALEIHLKNTVRVYIRGVFVVRNTGGLLVNSQRSSTIGRLGMIVKDSVFSYNKNSSTLAFYGNGYQKLLFFNNIVSMNYALHFDTFIASGMRTNITHNLFTNNTGLHCIDFRPHSLSSEAHFVSSNWFLHNTALGHGHQYLERYGYQPKDLEDEFDRRPKRQVLLQDRVSFDWWTHVGEDTDRYRSTIYAGTSNEIFRRNIFDNPGNTYEIASRRITSFNIGSIDAKDNYWGYPGTISVASGKIRDYNDYKYLTKVEYDPVFESNTSLIDGDCPGGWFQAGINTFKACFLYVGATTTYRSAVTYCEEIGAFLPYLRANDPKQKQLADRIMEVTTMFTDIADRYDLFISNNDRKIWISGVSISSTHCGWLSSKTGNIGMQNCNNLLPFICEKGLRPYEEPRLWRSGILSAVIAVIVLLILLFLLTLCWYCKSRHRDNEELSRKELIRASLRLKKLEDKHADLKFRNASPLKRNYDLIDTELYNCDDNVIAKAHRDMIRGIDSESSPIVTLRNSCSKSSIVTLVTDYGSSNKSSNFVTKTLTSGSHWTPIEPNYLNAQHSSRPNRNDNLSMPNHVAKSVLRANAVKNSQNHMKDDEFTYASYSESNNTVQYSASMMCSTCPTDSEIYSELDLALTERSSWNETCSTHSLPSSDCTLVDNSSDTHSRELRRGLQAKQKSANLSRRVGTLQLPKRTVMTTMTKPTGTNDLLDNYSKLSSTNHYHPRPGLSNTNLYLSKQHISHSSRSLIDLVNRHPQSQRRNSLSRVLLVETSM